MAEVPIEPQFDLNGWKEIASHLGRSVRTVQRWEREMGLPVRRVRAVAGDVVYASRAELHEWTATRALDRSADPREDRDQPEHAPGPPPKGEDEPGEPPRGHPTPPQRSMVAGAVLLFGAMAVVAWIFVFRGGQPARGGYEDGALTVRDEGDRVLWRRRLPHPPDATPPPVAPFMEPGRVGPVAVGDFDGDGRREVLTTAAPRGGTERTLYCMEADGGLRFAHSVTTSVRYGGEWIAPPWSTVGAMPRRGGGFWVLSQMTFFPAVVQQLTTSGTVVASYWLAGHVSAMIEMRLGGQPVLVIGSTRNEDFGAAVSILDADHPGGVAPADDSRYRCESCAGPAPSGFIVFPRTEPGRRSKSRTLVREIRPVDDGFLVLIDYPPAPFQPGSDRACPGGAAWYRFDERLTLRGAEYVDAYPACHAALEQLGQVDHPFGRLDEEELLNVRVWRRGSLGTVAP